MTPERIAVAMSGGVDSSVAAALLVDQGFDVFGVMMRLWVEPGGSNRCCSPNDIAHARRIAARLQIPFYVLDMQQTFHTEVVTPFLRGYAQGVTPNPCIDCNRQIRWTHLLREVLALGADRLATGHYARIREAVGGELQLLRGLDPTKDQSYVLSILSQEQLRRAVFPLGDWLKADVQARARERGLEAVDRGESQDLCFLGGSDYRDFIRRHSAEEDARGPIVDMDGRRLGTHQGLSGFTIGQRKGIGIPTTEPLFVVQKDARTRTLTVGPRTSLDRSRFDTLPAGWISGHPPAADLGTEVQVRYRAKCVPCRIEVQEGGRARVHLDQPLPDITPGQSAVFYHGAVCLGGGVIAA